MRYNQLLKRDNTDQNDIERQVLFFIISGNDDLYSKVHHIYNFEERCIEPDCLENSNTDFSSGSKALIRIGFNLYNGFKDARTDVMNVLSPLDTDNFNLAMEAIRIRFKGQ